jgi:hypothetical protein
VQHPRHPARQQRGDFGAGVGFVIHGQAACKTMS